MDGKGLVGGYVGRDERNAESCAINQQEEQYAYKNVQDVIKNFSFRTGWRKTKYLQSRIFYTTEFFKTVNCF